MKKTTLTFKIIKWLIWLFYPKTKIVGLENLPEEASVIVGNHSQLHGPVACELYFPNPRYTWCAGQMMTLKEVPDYSYTDFWGHKPRFVRWLYRLLSYLIAPLSVCIFNNANTIPVYHDNRVLITFKTTVTKLKEGAHVIVFPEHDQPYNHILSEFQDKFIDVAKLYYKRTGKELSFVPMYLAPYLKTIFIGKPIRFQTDRPIDEERRRICQYLMEQITELAISLPEHTVVPYRNIAKKNYMTNIPKENVTDEKAGR